MPSLVFSQETTQESQAKNLKALNFVTLMDPNLDWWIKVPPNTVSIKNETKIYRGEKFLYIPLVANSTKTANEPYKLKYTIFLSKENSDAEILRDDILEGVLNVSGNVILLPPIGIVFEDSDEYGNYIFTLNLENVLSGEQSLSTYKLELIPWAPSTAVSGAENINDTVKNFNQLNDPALLYSTFLSEDFTFYQRGSWHGLNPVTYSYFLNAFDKFDFLYEHLIADFQNQNSFNRQKIIMLNFFAKRDAIDENILSRDDIAFQNYVRNELSFDDNPYEKLESLSSVDLLWGEFFAKGTYEPVRRILDILAFFEDAEYAKEIMAKKTKPDSSENAAKLIRGILYLAAEKSLKGNAQNKLLQNYLKWADVNDLTPALKLRLRTIFAPKTTSTQSE